MKKLSLLLIATSVAATASVSTKLTSNTLMELMQLREVAQTKGGTAPSIQVYVKYNNRECIDSLKLLGMKIQTVTPSILTAIADAASIEAASQLDGVDCIEVAQRAKLMMDAARKETRVDAVHKGEGEIKSPFTGAGTLVGVIDGGLDFTHPAFYAKDGKTLRIKSVWCQADDKGTPPANFSYGSCYDTQQSILAQKSDNEYWSHGCHVMGIAAGSDLASPYYGVATDADLVFSSFSDIDVGISDAIKYIFNIADKENKPAVINMSLGTNMGPHDGSSLRDIMIDELTGPGRIVVGAAGNNAQINMHISKKFTSADDRLFAGIGFLEDMSGVGELQVWGEPGANMKVRICTVDKTTMEPVYQSRAYNCATSYNTTVTLQKPYDESSGNFTIVTQRSPLNNRPMAHIKMAISDYKPGKVIAIIVTGDPGSTVHAWANENMCCFMKHLPVMDEPDNKFATCEIGGTGRSIITVGSYSSRTELTKLDGTLYNSTFALNDIAPYSNIGPTADGRMKPDVAAPGSLIVSAFNNTVSRTEQVAEREWNGKKYYYGVYQGTSMASPHVAGIVATWLQACPTLTPDDIRTVLAATSRHDQYTGAEFSSTWGYGKIDAYAGLTYILKHFGLQSSMTSPMNSNLDAQIVSGKLRLLYMEDIKDIKINIMSVSGMPLISYKEADHQCGDVVEISLESLSSGMYVAEISGAKKRMSIKFVK